MCKRGNRESMWGNLDVMGSIPCEEQQEEGRSTGMLFYSSMFTRQVTLLGFVFSSWGEGILFLKMRKHP